MKHSSTKTILLLIMAFILTTRFLPVKNYKCIATDSHKAGFVIEKLFTETTVHYDKAKRNNRELVRVIIGGLPGMRRRRSFARILGQGAVEEITRRAFDALK